MSRCPHIIAAIGAQISQIGLHKLSVAKVLAGLKNSNLDRIPSLTVVSKLMKEHYALSYRHYDTAKIRYNHPAFDEKRLWVAKLVTYLLKSNAVVVSIDESSFCTKLPSSRRWQPKYSSVKLL
jgi:hypothetical protein